MTAIAAAVRYTYLYPVMVSAPMKSQSRSGAIRPTSVPSVRPMVFENDCMPYRNFSFDGSAFVESNAMRDGPTMELLRLTMTFAAMNTRKFFSEMKRAVPRALPASPTMRSFFLPNLSARNPLITSVVALAADPAANMYPISIDLKSRAPQYAARMYQRTALETPM